MNAEPRGATGPARAAAAGAFPALVSVLPVLVLGAVIYADFFRGLWTTWTTNDNYSHGPLVPLVSAALVWGRRHRLAGLPRRGSWLGLAPVVLACAMQVVGLRSDVFTLQGWSVPVLVAGLVWTGFGLAWLRALAFPIAFLVFMLTFPPLVVNQLSFALKEVTVRFAERASELLGVTLLRDGMTLYLTGGELRIENPCSGLRSLLALLATGALFAALQPGGLWRRFALFALAIPVAVVANAVRITALILVGHYAGIPAAGGIAHDLSGYAVYVLALLGLLAARHALRPPEARVRDPRPALEAITR